MTLNTFTPRKQTFFSKIGRRLRLFLSVFGPATITAMADNDASGVATYAVAGAILGYPVLFLLVIVTILLGVTQEMGIRLTVVTRKGLADLIRERFGVRSSVFMFAALVIANMGILLVDATAVKVTAEIFHLPPAPVVIAVVVLAFLMIIKGNYKLTQSLMLVASLFFIVYIFSAVKAAPVRRTATRTTARATTSRRAAVAPYRTGTPNYMAPEVVRRKQTDQRLDIF